ncbi:MAG: class I SAM-dependent methyltransferase [Pseudomonadota bacterium]
MIILDIGCGRKKLPGSIGIDASTMSDADHIIDLNSEPLPMKENSVDYVHSSHALEHFSKDGFFWIMGEIYRVLKPDATLYIVVPYFNTNLNIGNIFHNNNIAFNEHTFRFFSSAATTPALLPEDYATPSCPQWGLRYSAHMELGTEFELQHTELYYLPEFQNASSEEKRHARNAQFNVVEQISYHLRAVKPCPDLSHTAPKDNGTEVFSYIDDQIKYHNGQFDYIHTHSLADRRNDKDFMASGSKQRRQVMIQALKLSDEGPPKIERQNTLYIVSGLLYPPHAIIHMLSTRIQLLQEFIDATVTWAAEQASA